jgi:hypothetical protein
LDFVSVDFWTNAWVDDGSDFWWLIGDDWGKVPFDDQLRHSSKMAPVPAILDLVSIDFLTNACVDWSDFLVAHWGYLEEGSFRCPAPLPIQHGYYSSFLAFGFR